jgi:O-antigen/teichoic acid export membrane protein
MSFLRKGITAAAGQIMAVAVGMVVGILYRRALGPDGMGQYDVFRSAAVIAATIPPLGLGNASIYFLNNRNVPHVNVVTNSVKFTLVAGAALALVLSCIVLLKPGYFGDVHFIVAALFSLGVAASMGMNILRPVFAADLAVKRMVLVDLSWRLVLLFGGLALFAFGWLRPEAAIIVLAAGQCFSWFMVLFLLRHHVKLSMTFDWKLLFALWRYGLKLAAANILFVMTSNMTILLLRSLSPEGFANVGLYTAAVAVAAFGSLVPTAMGPLMFAKWAKEMGEARTSQAERAVRMNLVYGVAATFFLFLFGKYMIWLMYGAEFLGGLPALIILAPALIFSTVFNVFNNLLAGDGRAALTAWVLLMTLIIVVAMTFALVPRMGIEGAAIAVFCGNFFNAMTTMLICRRLYRLSPLRCLVLQRGDIVYARQALLGKRGKMKGASAPLKSRGCGLG